MPNPDRFLLPHELPDEFREFLAGLNQAHQPRDAHERMLVQELADASWAWQRPGAPTIRPSPIVTAATPTASPAERPEKLI